MARPTLHIEFLSEAEKLSLTDLYHHSTSYRQRERCKAILLNHDGLILIVFMLGNLRSLPTFYLPFEAKVSPW